MDHVVSCALAKLSISINSGASRVGCGRRVFSPCSKVATSDESPFVLTILVRLIRRLLNLGERFEHKDHLAWQRPFSH